MSQVLWQIFNLHLFEEKGMICDPLQDHQGLLWFATKDGLNRSKYFSTCFKERFGVTPSGFVAGE